MNELASYSIQAIAFAVIAMLAISRSKKADFYQLFLISAWLVGVIVIYARYGEEQVLFYSNDQLFHRQIIEYYLPIEGLTAEGIIGLRYLLTVPVYAVSLIGLHPMLLNKFVQLIALLLIYQQSKSYLNPASSTRQSLASSIHHGSVAPLHEFAFIARRDPRLFCRCVCSQ